MIRAAAILVAVAVPALAGPLTPPSGPVVPTPGPEPRTPISLATTPGDADSVFRITQPGSYYLTADVIGAPGKHGIEISASGDVTIDLNGFRVAGGPGSLRGITTTGGVSNGRIAIRNGAVAHWLSGGIVTADQDRSTLIDSVTVHDNSGNGIDVGPASVVTRCIAKANGGTGIRVEESSAISECVSSTNGAGFVLGVASTATNCSALANSQAGFSASGFGTVYESCAARQNGGRGFEGNSAVYTACVATANQGGGFSVGTDSVVTGCQARDNNGIGFLASEGSSLAHCVARSNGTGFQFSQGVTADHCTALHNSGHGVNANAAGCVLTACTARANGGSGFFGTHSVFTTCVARENTLAGFDAGSGCIVTGCIAQGNNADGIRVIEHSVVLNNVSQLNGVGFSADAAGIHALGENNRIEGNTCTGNDRGIHTDDSSNIIVRNNVHGANPFVLTGGQAIGPMITGPNTITSTNPWANFNF